MDISDEQSVGLAAVNGTHRIGRMPTTRPCPPVNIRSTAGNLFTQLLHSGDLSDSKPAATLKSEGQLSLCQEAFALAGCQTTIKLCNEVHSPQSEGPPSVLKPV